MSGCEAISKISKWPCYSFGLRNRLSLEPDAFRRQAYLATGPFDRMSDLKYWLAFARHPKMGAVRIGRLAAAFPSMEAAFAASRDELVAAGIDQKTAFAFEFDRSNLDPDRELALLGEHGIHAVTLRDPAYPAELKTVYDPPAVLFVRGTLPARGRMHLAVVGSRHPTAYGKRVTEEFVRPIATSGAVVVSGLAYGVDAVAHRATLDAGGTTVAVLGGGLDEANVYPSQHRALAAQIVAGGGAVVTEFPIGTHVMKQNFPFRNRVIAGFSRGTLVIEARATSGSLITARAALEAGRDVFAVPGPIHSELSEGPNNLIKAGAFAVTSPQDVLSRLGMEVRETKPDYAPGSPEEAALYAALSPEAQHADELTAKTGLAPQTVTSALTLMEMKGSARHLGGLYYVRG
jgi:DNA processing protein